MIISFTALSFLTYSNIFTNEFVRQLHYKEYPEVVIYKIPEIGIYFPIEEQYAENIIYSVSDVNLSRIISFNSKQLMTSFKCPPGQSGIITRTEIGNDLYEYHYTAPHSPCTPNGEDEGYGIPSANVIRRSLDNKVEY